MNLSLYCSVAEACEIAGVSRPYMHILIKSGKVEAQMVGRVYLVSRASAAGFKRTPGLGRPKKATKRPRPAKKTAKRRGK